MCEVRHTSNPKPSSPTQAAEFQAEEADIALANTLDALRASGASAGGATALAQAALQSKRGISASIEKQEAVNQKFRADGEASLQLLKQSEAIRVQSAQLGEAKRLQQADVAGREATAVGRRYVDSFTSPSQEGFLVQGCQSLD